MYPLLGDMSLFKTNDNPNAVTMQGVRVHMTLGNRLKQVRKIKGMTQKKMASELNVAASTYQHYERYEREATASFLSSLVTAFGLNPLWLITGQGVMFTGGQGQAEKKQGEISIVHPVLSESARKTLEEDHMVRNTLEMLADMSEDQRREICRYAEKEKLLGELLKERKNQTG